MSETPEVPSTERSPREWALAVCTSEIDTHLTAIPWDGQVYLFALIRTAEALASDPAFAAEAPAHVRAEAEENPEHLTAVVQDNLPAVETTEELLATIAWPQAVHGAAIALERIVLPPQAEAELGANPSPEDYLTHPDREDVRMVVSALRTGETWSVIRMRHHDDEVLGGANLVPQLTEALHATLRD
ncbi:MAG: PPA1309 family protein [Bowdeniella nasicola]|nr:PPA1309 family protein [Bowdeniella nasicola]